MSNKLDRDIKILEFLCWTGIVSLTLVFGAVVIGAIMLAMRALS